MNIANIEKAHEILGTGRNIGKIVLVVSD
jgi:hypothetical protein